MIRVHIICEGQSEERFVNELLIDHFLNKNIKLRQSYLLQNTPIKQNKTSASNLVLPKNTIK